MAVFGGDVVISGSLYDSNGDLIAGSGGGTVTSGSFNVPDPSEFVTTASLSLAGGLGFDYTADTQGNDTFFFVSGAIDSKDSTTKGTSVFGGDLVVSGALALNQGAAAGSHVHITTEGKVGIGTNTPAYKLSVGGSMEVGEFIYHRNDSDTFIQFADDSIGITAGNEQLVTIAQQDAGQDFIKIGDGGDVDFQVRTLGDDNTLYVEGASDRVGIGTNAPPPRS